MSLDRFRVIPFTRFTPQNCAVVADRGRAAIEALSLSQRIRPITSRLATAVHHLDQVAARRSYGETPEDWDATLEAIQLCLDFFQVAASFGPEPIAPAAPELALALQGSLSATGATRKAREYLSQYWVGTMLTLANLEPRIIDDVPGRKRPDFVSDLGGFDCALEVKRPESFRSARDALDRAAGQLRSFGKPGVACLDLTDCLWRQNFSTAFLDSPVPIRDRVWPVFKSHARRLTHRVETYNQSDKYARVFAIVLFARFSGWRGKKDPQPEGSYLLYIPTFDKACQGLVTEYAERFKRFVLTGFERMSDTKPEAA